MTEDEDDHGEQYSIWPADRENAPGWHDAGPTGTKEDCLAARPA